MQMLTLYEKLFSALEKQNVGYAIWKNLQEMPDALSGNSDIDLYVYPGCTREFLSVLHSLGFIRVISHKPFPCVEHYYGHDAASGKFAHLHCYYRIVTGESHIKQFVVPIERYLQAYPSVRNAQGIREIHPLLQKKLNIFRRKIKLSCLPGALLFFRERHGYQQEQELSTLAVQSTAGEREVGNLSGWLAEMDESPSTRREILDGLRYRFQFRHWNRFNPTLTPLFRYHAILIRLLGKLRKQKKTLPIGITLAITGTDNAVVRQFDTLICNWMKKHFSIQSLNDDGRDASFTQWCLKLSPEGSDGADTGQPVPAPSLAFLMLLTLRAWQWRGRVRRKARRSMSGSIVIWNACEMELARLALQTFTQASWEQSRLKAGLLQICSSLLRFEPEISVRLHIGSSILKQPATPVITSLRPSEPALSSLRYCHADAIPVIAGTWPSGLCSEQGILDENHLKECSRIKQELWEAVSSLQY